MKEFITWKQYNLAVLRMMNYYLDNNLNCGAIYGLPRGGLPIAVSLSHALNLPLLMSYSDKKIITDKKILVVDDIADTGETLNNFSGDKNVIFTIHYHRQSKVVPDCWIFEKRDNWIVYPWEKEGADEIQNYLSDKKVIE